jgi:hypothetical protein
MLRSFILFAGLILALGLAGCPQQADQPAGDAEVTEEEVVIESAPVEDAANDAADAAGDASDAADDAADAAGDAADDATDGSH